MEDTAIDEIRAIAEWSNSMSEDFNMRVVSVKDWEVLHRLAEEHEMEFIDDEYLSSWFTANDDDEHDKFMKEANAALGYKLYEV